MDDLDKVDFVFSNVNSSRKEALLYIFEDNEEVIKMIIKGNKSHQYDLTIHFHFGSVVQVSTNSAALVSFLIPAPLCFL